MAEGIENDETAEGDALLEAVCKEIPAGVTPYFHVAADRHGHLGTTCGCCTRSAVTIPTNRGSCTTTIKGDYGLGYFEGNAQGDKILEMTV